MVEETDHGHSAESNQKPWEGERRVSGERSAGGEDGTAARVNWAVNMGNQLHNDDT